MNPKVEDLDLEVTDSPSRFNFIIPVTKQGKVPCQWRGLELEHLPTESLSPSPIMPCVPGDCLQAIKAQGDLVPSLNGRENRLSRCGSRTSVSTATQLTIFYIVH